MSEEEKVTGECVVCQLRYDLETLRMCTTCGEGPFCEECRKERGDW